ncbi:hypothetical protein BP6252_04962 [Coleophoma cylindrospora]|uniref:Zn(2)-C6 fungal-type domain-containing protein n=1 Tax=Coleophoma cylindrospora TaxID=1849047 RepID=A0A3D8RS93_9HELO|nr:hypothetical protein BP6252_04962 [Coleophoma cylindrospora]
MSAVRDRASKVCVNCHARKVKCDLQTSPDGVCSNCHRLRQPCIERQGARKKRPTTSHRESLNADTESQQTSTICPQETAPSQSAGVQSDRPSSRPAAQGSGVVSHCSSMYYGEYSEAATFDENLAVTSSHVRDTLLEPLRADAPPRLVVFRAWAEAYMSHAFHHCPVLEQQDLTDSPPSVVLQKAISMVANLMRHDPHAPEIATELYERIKILICTNSELDPVQNLKILCLLTLWNCRPSTPVSVDGPWYWIGVGLRLVVQMGLYQESTYLNRTDASCLRRMFWYLRNSESLHVSCWGYPPHLRPRDFDIKLPTVDDFGTQIFQGLWFIESTKLCTITSRVSELQAERRLILPEEHTEVKTALYDWTSGLPVELQLYDSNGSRNAYCRSVSELAIQYFVTIVLSEFLKYRENPKSCQGVITSLLAGSCGATLYDEIFCRDESVFLPQVHGFFCLALALPLLDYHPQSAKRVTERKRHLTVLRSVLTAISDRYGDAKMSLRMIDYRQGIMARTARPSDACDSVPEPQAFLEARRLFPFPRTFCDNMDLLESSTGVGDLFSVNNFAPMSDDASYNFTWLDAFGLDHSNANLDINDFPWLGEFGLDPSSVDLDISGSN